MHDIAGNQPTSIEWQNVAYTVQRVMALRNHPHGKKGTVLHMSRQHAPQFAECYLLRVWHSESPSLWRILLCYIPLFDQVQLIQTNSRLRLLDLKSLHAIRELVCVCVIAAKRTKLTSSYIQRLRFKPAAINLWSVTRRCRVLLLCTSYTPKVAKMESFVNHYNIFCIFGWVCIKIAMEYR